MTLVLPEVVAVEAEIAGAATLEASGGSLAYHSETYLGMVVVVVVAEEGAVVVVLGVAGAYVTPPFYRLGKSVGAGTRTEDSWCGRCGYMVAFCRLSSCPHDR